MGARIDGPGRACRLAVAIAALAVAIAGPFTAARPVARAADEQPSPRVPVAAGAEGEVDRHDGVTGSPAADAETAEPPAGAESPPVPKSPGESAASLTPEPTATPEPTPTPTPELRRVPVGLALDAGIVRDALLGQVFTEGANSVRAWDDESGCNHLTLSDPEVSVRDGLLRVRLRGEGRAATRVAGWCTMPYDWTGRFELDEEPRLEEGGRVVAFRIAAGRVLDEEGRVVAPRVRAAGWLGEHVEPRLEDLRLPVDGMLRGLAEALPEVLPRGAAAAGRRILDSASIEEVRVGDGPGLLLRGRVTVEIPAAVESPGASEPPLDAAEMAAVGAAIEAFEGLHDAVVRRTGDEGLASEVREALVGAVHACRDDVVAALSAPGGVSDERVRAVLAQAWSRTAPLLRRVAEVPGGPPGIRILGFVPADAMLRILDDLGSSLGPIVTGDGLRRLARRAAVEQVASPGSAAASLDPRLREVFGDAPATPTPTPLPSPAPGAPVEAAGPAG